MLRGCCPCAIPERPTPLPRPLFAKSDRLVALPLSSSLAVDCKLSAVGCLSPLSLIIPVHPRNSPVTPIIPVHTQKQGGGACFLASSCKLSAVDCELSFSPNSFVFSCRSYYTLTYINNNIVGAPTYCKSLATGARTPNSGPPKKDGPYKNCELSTVDCRLALAKHAFCRGMIKYVGAPTCLISSRPSSLRVSAFSAPLRYLFLSLFRYSPPATGHSPLATKSNYSRTYAKTRGSGPSFDFQL